MHHSRGRAVVGVLSILWTACGSGGSSEGDGGSGGVFNDISTTAASFGAATEAPGGASGICPEVAPVVCGDGWCCPEGDACVDNPGDQLGCGTDVCCTSCGSGLACGGGCCPDGTACRVNDGGMPGCSSGFCCEALAEDETCAAEVAARCQPGTTCRKNHSARACVGSEDACYLPAGQIGCPGEVLCPNGVDFCPAGDRCGSTSGVCPVGSTSGNYCCMPADPCAAAGSWVLECPDATGCGTCPTAFAYALSIEVTPDIAFAGGSWDDGSRSYAFDPSTCTLSWNLNGTPCSPLPGNFTLSAYGTGQSTFGCWSDTCECTQDRPTDSCTATKL